MTTEQVRRCYQLREARDRHTRVFARYMRSWPWTRSPLASALRRDSDESRRLVFELWNAVQESGLRLRDATTGRFEATAWKVAA